MDCQNLLRKSNRYSVLLYFSTALFYQKLFKIKDYLQYISINPEIRFGKPCIKGTRISVADILGWLAIDMTNKEILDDFPSIKEKLIKAALIFAVY